MSWDSYTDTLIQYPGVTDACLCGQDGAVWARSKNFQMKPEEVVELAQHVSSASTQANHYDGKKLMTIRAADGCVTSRTADVALSATSSKTAVIIAIHTAPGGNMPMGVNQQLASATEKVADHLRGLDY